MKILAGIRDYNVIWEQTEIYSTGKHAESRRDFQALNKFSPRREILVGRDPFWQAVGGKGRRSIDRVLRRQT